MGKRGTGRKGTGKKVLGEKCTGKKGEKKSDFRPRKCEISKNRYKY